MGGRHKKARRFSRPPRQTIPTGGKGYSTPESIVDSPCSGNVRYRTNLIFIAKQTPNSVKPFVFGQRCEVLAGLLYCVKIRAFSCK